LTFSFWFNTQNYCSSIYSSNFQNDNIDYLFVGIHCDYNKVIFFYDFDEESLFSGYYLDANINLNQWYHVAITAQVESG